MFLIVPLGKKGSTGIPIFTLFICVACVIVHVFTRTNADQLALAFYPDQLDPLKMFTSVFTHTDIWHLLRLPSLSAPGIAVQGGPETIAPAGRHGTAGASWRMVVELGPEVHAYATYPGGQSGNPASPWYANRIPQWASGGLDTLTGNVLTK